ncbi:MAG: DUF2442 domain-containing protein [Spirochaetae bacterium HGW-Spirochaetae-5]|nr:MAG: DUF2442 domain-containing protein [Spirochaetae bacterium HGW-Spirochaetae-5]
MSSLKNDARADKIWFDQDNMWVLFTDGRQLSVPLAYFPRLQKATMEQRENFVMSGGGYGLHWDELDEDIHVQNLLAGSYERVAV